ncbi:MAG: hypothetical protein ACOZQL_16010 [Myxococcota bacterium]
MPRPLILSSLVVLAGCTGNPFFIEAEAASICQHLTGQRFQVPTDVRQQLEALPEELRSHVAVSRTFAFDVTAQLPVELQQMSDLDFALTSISLTAVQDSVDLGFVDEAHVTLQPGTNSSLPARQFDYLRTEEAPRTVRWDGESFDVAAYLQSGDLQYQVSLVGGLPDGDVVVDVEACAAATIRVQYLQ